MIRANIEAAIEAKQKEKTQIENNIIKLDKVIENLKEQQKRLIEKHTDIFYELEELKDELQNNY